MKIWLFLTTCLFLVIGGCGYKDIDKRFFVVGMGIDKESASSSLYKVTLKIAIPPEKPSAGTNDAEMLSAESDSITGAIRLIQSKLDKELDFNHAKAIIFGKAVAEKDITEILDWFIRRRDIQGIAYMAIGMPSAEDVLSIKTKSERLAGNSLFLYFGRTGTESPYVITEYLFDFYRRLSESGIDPILPIIEAEGDRNTISTAAVFKDGQMKLALTPTETSILNAFFGGISKIDIEIEENGEHFFLFTDSVKMDYQIVKGRYPFIRIECKMSVTIEESKQPTTDKEMKHLEQLAEREISQRILRVVKKFQKQEVDPIGFGLRYRANHSNNHDEWEKWKELYPLIEFKVDPMVDITSSGLIK